MNSNEKRKVIIIGLSLLIVVISGIIGLNIIASNLSISQETTNNLDSTLPSQTLPEDDGDDEVDIRW